MNLITLPNTQHLIFLIAYRLVQCVMCAFGVLILLQCMQRDLTSCNSHRYILTRALRDALLTFKLGPLTVTRLCLTTCVPAGFIADPLTSSRCQLTVDYA